MRCFFCAAKTGDDKSGAVVDACDRCATLIREARVSCLHLAACEIERAVEFAKPWSRDAKTLRRIRGGFLYQRYRRKCPCPTCGEVRRGAYLKGAPSVRARAQADVDLWRQQRIDDEEGEVVEGVNISRAKFQRRFGNLTHPEKDALLQHFRQETSRGPVDPDGLAASATPTRPRTEDEWRFPADHVYVRPEFDDE